MVAVVAGWRWWDNHPPYGPEALAITSSLSLVSPGQAQAALGEKVPAPWSDDDRDRFVLGRIAWQPPPEPLDGGHFAIFLIDKRSDVRVSEWTASSARQEALDFGSDGREGRIAERYPWLRAAGAPKDEDGWVSRGYRLAVSDERASPLTIVASLPSRDGTQSGGAPVAMSDVLLALVHMGPRGQVYWAERLQG